VTPVAHHLGQEVHYSVQGEGEPVVLLHGLFESSDKWDRQGWYAAIPGSWRFVAIDAASHGRNPVSFDPSDYEPVAQVEKVLAVLDQEGIDRAHVVGYSMGAWLACNLARRAPQRLKSISLGGWDPINGVRTFIDAMQALGVELNFELLYSLAVSDQQFAANVANGDRAAFELAWGAINEFEDACEDLSAVKVPILLFCGDLDAYFHQMQLAASLLPGARFHPVAGSHHTSVELGVGELGPALAALFTSA
jgi:pimeloyl-ACP methyl ester carboxylesterase